MIQHQHIHTAFPQPCDGIHRRRAAVHGQEELRAGEFLEAVLHAVLTEAVALVHAMRQVEVHAPTERAEDFEQQRSRSDAVHVIVTEDDERLAALAGGEESVHGGGHVGQREGIGELLEAGFEKACHRLRFAVAAVEEALCEKRGDAVLPGELIGEHGLRRCDRPAVFHASSTLKR